MENKAINKVHCPKVFIRTFGCQMNVSDSEWMRSVVSARKWEITDLEENADVILLNTCSVRALAEEKVFSKLGELGVQKKRGRNLILGITGCMAQNYGKKIFDRAPYVNIVCGSYRFGKIDKLIDKVLSGSTHVLDIERKDEPESNKRKHLKKIKVTGFVPIMRGCNNKCSYCIVPHVRGPERSRPADEIISEITTLVDDGYKEVTLLGQNVNSYKHSGFRVQDSVKGFVKLLTTINQIQGLERIRFVTSHPKDASLELFNAMKDLDKICESIHLPVQSGSNEILRKMNRRYSREHYLDLVKNLKDMSLSTDIIVGFPGETEKTFEDTYILMNEVRFDSAFIFKYSTRPGTPAEKLEDNVPLEVKKKRNNILLRLQDEISLEKNKKLIGTKEEILIEGISKNNKNRLMGRTRSNKIVVVSGKSDLIGQFITVKIKDATAHTLYGKM